VLGNPIEFCLISIRERNYKQSNRQNCEGSSTGNSTGNNIESVIGVASVTGRYLGRSVKYHVTISDITPSCYGTVDAIDK
jgi:hypothetical protein